jgi:hypothetical protein
MMKKDSATKVDFAKVDRKINMSNPETDDKIIKLLERVAKAEAIKPEPGIGSLRRAKTTQ